MVPSRTSTRSVKVPPTSTPIRNEAFATRGRYTETALALKNAPRRVPGGRAGAHVCHRSGTVRPRVPRAAHPFGTSSRFPRQFTAVRHGTRLGTFHRITLAGRLSMNTMRRHLLGRAAATLLALL